MAKETKVKEPTKAELVEKEVEQLKASGVDEKDFYGVQNDDGTWEPWDPKGKPVVSRAAAATLGFSRYFTGEECVNGHLSPRKVKGSRCIACAREKLKERAKKKRAEDPEFRAAQNAKAREKAKARKAAKAA